MLRGADTAGRTNALANDAKCFVRQAAMGGIELFRDFDGLNGVEKTRV